MQEQTQESFIPRCPKCSSIPFLSLIHENDGFKFEYECENKHKGVLSFIAFKEESSKYSLDKIECLNCKKNRKENINLNFFYCFQCKNYLCKNCLMIHDEKHVHIVSTEKLDGFCNQHFNSYSNYCSEHKKNLCVFCIDEQHNHCRLSKIENFSENEKNAFMDEINKAIKIKKEIEEFQKQINEEFDNLKRKMDEIIFLKNFLFSFENLKKYFIYNYNIVHNLKELKNIVEYNQVKKYEFLSKYANKLINLLKKGNYKTIKKHTNYVDHIKILPDGRLSSCSEDGTINIYDK